MYPTNQAKIDSIVLNWEQASRMEPEYAHVQAALTQTRVVTQAKESEINQLLRLLENIIEKSELTIPEVKSNILKKIGTDLELIQELNNAIANNNHLKTIAYPLKTNKVQDIVEGTHTFIEDKFDQLLALITDKQSLEGYDFTAVALPHLDDPEKSFYGSSKQVIFTTALIYIFLTYQALRGLDDIQVQTNINQVKQMLQWFDVSPFAHTTFIPDEIIEQCPSFKTSTFYFEQYDTHKSHGLSYPSGGYTFGGGRNETRYYEENRSQKLLIPGDCSAFIANCIGLQSEHTSTKSLYQYFKPPLNVVDSSSTEELANFPNHLEATIQDPKDPQQIQPGMLWMNKLIQGGGGHTAIVLETPRSSEDMLKTIGCNRNMPVKEGLGLEENPLSAKTGRGYFFFEVKDPKPTFPVASMPVWEYTILSKQ